MKRSEDRILTTHVGSFPRPKDLLALVTAKLDGGPVDENVFDATVETAVQDVVRRQCDLAIDVVNDGEFGKPGFVSYISDRLDGLEAKGLKGSSWRGSKEEASFPEYYEMLAQTAGGAATSKRIVCVAPIKYSGRQKLQKELSTFASALQSARSVEQFVSSISLNNASDWIANEYYRTEEEFLTALADALNEEYRAIVDSGFLVQVDDPQLATIYMRQGTWTLEEYKRWASARVEFLNYATRGIPKEKIRFHTCYSIDVGPRIHDLELKHFVNIMLRVNAGAYSFEAANPRHEHEWRVWEEVKLPDDAVLLPGVITHATIIVEHPELVAERIARFASVVGRERVIASADCGFASFAVSKEARERPAEVVWEKLRSLSEGARLASRKLWNNA